VPLYKYFVRLSGVTLLAPTAAAGGVRGADLRIFGADVQKEAGLIGIY